MSTTDVRITTDQAKVLLGALHDKGAAFFDTNSDVRLWYCTEWGCFVDCTWDDYNDCPGYRVTMLDPDKFDDYADSLPEHDRDYATLKLDKVIGVVLCGNCLKLEYRPYTYECIDVFIAADLAGELNSITGNNNG